TLNGIALVPAPGTRIFVEPRLGDGRVRSDGPITIEFGAGISRTVPRLNLNGLATGGNVVNRVLGLGGPGFSIAGLEVELSAGLEFKADNGGQVTVSFAVKLPDVFRALPGAPGPPTIQFAPTFSNDKGLTVAGKLKLETVYLFGVKITDFELAFDSATGVFEGGFGMELGPPLRGVKPTLSGTIAMGPTNEPCELRKLSLQASNLNRHISHGVFLQRLGGTFECIREGANVSIKLSANAGVSLGPRVSVNDVAIELVSVDGTVSLSIPVRGNAPLKLGIEGVGKIVDVPIATSNVTYTAPARIDMSGQIDLTFGGYGAQFGYGDNVFVSPDAFNLEARGSVNLFGLRYEAETVFSSRGFAVCLGEPGEKVGFGKRWGGELATFALCDVGPFRAQASQAGDRVVTVDGMTVIAARGNGTPPKVVVTGPGERIETPAGPEPLRRDGVLLVQDPDRNTTFVVLFKPRKGRYTVSGAQSVSVAESLPPLKVHASVRRGVLRWRATGLAGQRLELVEHANGLAHRLLVTRRASGRIRLKPDLALAPRRRIEAIAYNGATPRASVTVARYRAALPRKPGRVRGVKLRRGVLSWRAVRGAVRYELALTAADGTTRTVTTRRTRLRARPRAVAIVAFNAAGKPGPITRKRLQ
ncbi:MAG TPA: hypothetical protein VFZ00_10185, partial [Solirubrobacter sp.]|nr:hypothetical protein [Solirubrobacter sp.]